MLLYLNYLKPASDKVIPKNRLFLALITLIIGELPRHSYATYSPDDRIKFFVASSFLYDSNFLRISDSSDTVQLTGKSDKSEYVKQIKFGLDVDWQVSRQHFIIKANANQNWFENFNTLDYLGWDTLAQWNWRIGNNLNGEIGYSNIQQLGSFDYTNALITNLSNSQRSFVNGSYLFHPNGRIKLDLSRNEYQFVDNGQNVDNTQNRAGNTNIENSIAFHLEYLNPVTSTNSLGLQVIATDGQYPQREITPDGLSDNAYTRMNYSITWDWIATYKTTFNGMIGYTHQNYAHFSDLDFADVVGDLSLIWKMSEKVLLRLIARRDISQYISQTSSFSLTQGIFFDSIWQFSQKITLTLPVSYRQQEFLGNATNSGVGSTEQRKDNVGSVGLNFKYNPLENISATALVNYENRDSNVAFRSYKTLSAGITLKVDF